MRELMGGPRHGMTLEPNSTPHKWIEIPFVGEYGLEFAVYESVGGELYLYVGTRPLFTEGY